jgi:hypothetical protein
MAFKLDFGILVLDIVGLVELWLPDLKFILGGLSM